MRKQQIEARMQDFLVSLRRKCENEILRLPTSLHQMTVKDFNELYSFNIRLALEGIKRQGFEQGKQEAEREREQGAVEATVRKRWVVELYITKVVLLISIHKENVS